MCETELDDDIVLVPQYLGDLACDPPAMVGEKAMSVNRRYRKTPGSHLLLHDLNIDLGHVHLLTELGRKLSPPNQLCIHAGRHFCERVR